ncbi:hypothetical protein ACQUFF_05330 [Mammaliicoccus sciuri]
MFNFNINHISHENKWIYHNEDASIIYVTNGYINIFYHTSNYMMTLDKGFCALYHLMNIALFMQLMVKYVYLILIN